MRWRFAKNALANLGRGLAAAVVALLLPPVLVRHMSPAAYSVWVLVLQTASYVGFLNLGLQTAIGRYVAFADEKGDDAKRDSVYSTAFAALCCAALAAGVLILAGILFAPTLFPGVPSALMSQMRIALLIVGLVMAAELPASAWNGVFIGKQRFELPALTVGGARLAWAIGVAVVAVAGYPLVAMAAVIACANLPSYLLQYLILRRVAPDVHFKPSTISKSTALELANYCFGLTVMSFSMLLVSGLDLILVGHFQFSAVTPYSVAAGLIALISGLLYAMINVLMPHAATLHAANKPCEMGQLVISSTHLSVLVLVLTGVPILILAGPIIHLWIGARYVAEGAPLLAVLIVANIIRLIGAPYSIVLISAGQQSYIKISPLTEGGCNFVASIVLGLYFGARGIALGTLLGAIIGIAVHLAYSMPRTMSAITLSRSRFLTIGVLYPLLWTSPLLAVAVASQCGFNPKPLATALAFLFSLSAVALTYLRGGFESKTSKQPDAPKKC